MSLMDKIHESGVSDTSIDDWFFKIDVLDCVLELKRKYPPMTPYIDEVFGDLTLDYDGEYE